MELRRKTLLIMGTMLALILIGVYWSVYEIMRQNYAALEQENVQSLVRDARLHLADEGMDLGRTLGDWASWDDTYAFMGNRTKEYVESNLEDASLAASHIDIIGFYDEDGRTVLVKMVAPGSAHAKPVPAELATLPYSSPLLIHEYGSTTGIMVLGNQLAAVASRPILTSKAEGPARGTMVMARYIGNNGISALAGSRASTSMWRIGWPMPEDFESAAKSMPAPTRNSTLVRPLNDYSVAGYFFAADVYGRNAAIFRVEAPRTEFAEFRKNAFYLIAVLIIMTFIFGTLTFVLLDRFLLLRIRRLGDQAGQVGRPGAEITDLALDGGNDEITRLAADINRMLERLRLAQQELMQSQVAYGESLKTEVKQKKRQLARSDQRRVEMEKEKNRQLESANAKLVKMEREKNKFLINMGHELKSPLAVVELNISSVMSNNMDKGQRDESMRMINRNIRKLKDKIEEIIQLSRFEYGQDMQKAPLDFVDLAKGVVIDYVDFAKARGVKITREGFGQVLMVNGDQRLLRYSLSNLVSNAVKHSGTGKPGAKDTEILVTIDKTKKEVTFSVADFGEGVAKQDQGKLFQKFFKADQNAPGTGVGLFITREVARGHGGNAWFEPNKPRGAVFRFSMPLAKGGG
ncbi:MAG: CHASE4 domain-containing protein [Candidatus Micrarchaeia archaeon]|jgi:signal transduction histidine kinase